MLFLRCKICFTGEYPVKKTERERRATIKTDFTLFQLQVLYLFTNTINKRYLRGVL